MSKGIIRLCYRKIIDSDASKIWDKLVFEDTYAEFKLQAQNFNQESKWNTFAELIRNVSGAEQLHFLVSAAVIGYLQQLNSLIPDLNDNLGRLFLPFSNYQFEIVNSDIHDQTRHQVAISFFSDELIWHDTISEYLILSKVEHSEAEFKTHLMQLQPFLSIYSLKCTKTT